MVVTGQHMEKRPVEGKPVILTGASSGIGAHITHRLVAGGARVTAADRRYDRLEALAEELSNSVGAISVIETDVTEANDVERMVQEAIDRYHGIDALVNNAGMEIQGRIEDLAESDLELMLRTNVVGPYLCLRAALPHLKQRGGSVINVGSTVVTRAPRYRFGYVASKEAVETMSRVWLETWGHTVSASTWSDPASSPPISVEPLKSKRWSLFRRGSPFSRPYRTQGQAETWPLP